MKTAGLIAEFNPLHNGHAYLMQKIKSENDALICVMSGNFVQRGDIAIADKWTRAKTALSCGADLVIELPVCFALNTAQKFAYGGIYLLHASGIADTVYFGSECGDIHRLLSAAHAIVHEPPKVSASIKQFLAQGMNYPTARQKAFHSLISEEILSCPNNILAIEYLCALYQLDSHIKPVTIARTGSGYHDRSPAGRIASATAVRCMLTDNEDFRPYMPSSAYDLIQTAITQQSAPYNRAYLSRALRVIVRTRGLSYLKTINDMQEGLENRIFSVCKTADTFDHIAEQIKTKRYTRAKIDRILMSILLGLTKELSQSHPQYFRVLGMNQTGMRLLAEMKKSSSLPIITKTADAPTSPMLEKDILATDLASLCLPESFVQPFGRDYTTPPVILS